MIFDKLLNIVKHLPRDDGLNRILKRSALFYFPGYAHVVLPQEYSAEQIQWLKENFFLPFQHIAVEDPGSCVLMWDEDRNVKGLGEHKRFFVECLPVDADPKAFYDGSKTEGCSLEDVDKNMCAISFGWFLYHSKGITETNWLMEGTVSRWFAASPTTLYVSGEGLDPSTAAHIEKRTLQNVGAAVEEVMYFNAPDRFILEEFPPGYAKRQKKGKKARGVARSTERPLYTVLKPREIREQMHLPEPQKGLSGTRRPHERRAHLRQYRSERYKNVRGKTVIIPATWIGPSENTVKNRRYRVRLDL